MKQKLFLTALGFSAFTSWSQLAPAPDPFAHRNFRQQSAEKTTACVDTLRYSYLKEAIMFTTASATFQQLGLSQASGRAMSHTFLLGSGSANVKGAEVYMARNPFSTATTVTVAVSLFNVDAGFIPTTQLATGTVDVTSTTPGLYYVNFSSPIAVTGNYAIVIEPTTVNGAIAVVVNNTVAGQPYDEQLVYTKGTAASSNGNYVTINAYYAPAQNYNFEPIVSPIVDYSVTASYTAPTSVCLGSPVNFASTSTPDGPLTSRFFNGNTFLKYWNLAAQDSTFIYDFDNAGSAIDAVAPTASYTYAATGTYNPDLTVNSGMSVGCTDVATAPITVNAIPAAPAITPAGPLTYCVNTPATLTSSASAGNLWSEGSTSATIAPTASGNYSVTVTENGCTSAASNVVSVTVTPADDATYSYPSYTLCTGGSPVSATTTTAGGTFSSTPAGLSLNAATGEITVATSSEGTYTVTYTTAGSCPGTSSHSVVVTSAPDASFTYSAGTYCATATDPTPSFGAGASAGTFSSTTGLVIDPVTGVIDLSASTAGTYTVTNNIAASGSCSATSATQTVVITAEVTPAFAAIAPICSGDALTLPATSTNGVAGTWSPAVNNTATTTYTFTPTAGQCATTTTLTVTVNQPVTPTFAAVGPFCSGSTIPALPTTSTNSLTGTWSPAINNTATTTYTFTPAAGQCATTTTLTITVNPQTTPAFTAIPVICQNATAPALPATSNNGIPGTWNPATISTATVGTATYTFTPAAGQCATTATLTVTIDDCLGLDENVFGDLSIFPNPTSGEITVSFTNTTMADVELSVMTNEGKLFTARTVKAGSVAKETIDMSTAAQGVYFIRLNTNNGAVVQKVVKQ